MKNLCLPTLLAAVVLSGAAVLTNAGPMVNPASNPPAATKPTTKPIFNKICPINKEAVDPEVKTVEYKGKKIGFCCPSCIADFKKDPEKYMKDLK